MYGTVRTRKIRTTGTYYGSSYRMIPAALHGHTLTGVRVPVLQNEDSSCSRLYVREYNASNTATTPIISDVCTAAAVDTACARGPPITYLVLVYQHEYVQGHCLSLETNVYRYSHEARMNEFNLSVEQYHTTYCRPGRSPACAQTKRSLAAPLRHRRLLLTVSCVL